MKLVTTEFKSGGLHDKHVVATRSLGNHLAYRHRETKKNLYFHPSHLILLSFAYLYLFYPFCLHFP